MYIFSFFGGHKWKHLSFFDPPSISLYELLYGCFQSWLESFRQWQLRKVEGNRVFVVVCIFFPSYPLHVSPQWPAKSAFPKA